MNRHFHASHPLVAKFPKQGFHQPGRRAVLSCPETPFTHTGVLAHSPISFNLCSQLHWWQLTLIVESGLLGTELKPLYAHFPKDYGPSGVMSLCHYILSQNTADRLKLTVLFPITQKPRLGIPIQVVRASSKLFSNFSQLED